MACLLKSKIIGACPINSIKMKKIIFFLALCAISIQSFAGGPSTRGELKLLNKTLVKEIEQKDSEITQLRDSLESLPDSTCVTLRDGSIICLPLKDAHLLGDSVWEYLNQKTSDGWPKDFLGWAFLIVGLFTGAEGARRLTAGKKIYEALKPVLKSRLGLAVVISSAISAILTAVLGSFQSFDWKLFLMVWPWLAIGASYIYEVFYKKEAKA